MQKMMMEMMLNVAESDSSDYSDASGDEESEYSKQLSKQNAADNIAGLPQISNEQMGLMNDIQGLIKQKVGGEYNQAKRRDFNMNPVGYNPGNQQAKVIEFNLDDI